MKSTITFEVDCKYDATLWSKVAGQERYYIKHAGHDYAVYHLTTGTMQKARGAWSSAAFRAKFESAFKAALEAEPENANAPATEAAPMSVEFDEHHDLETGITVYTLRQRLSAENWKRVAHLFERDVELDCPSYNAWNESVTLPWATSRPEQVEEVLGVPVEQRRAVRIARLQEQLATEAVEREAREKALKAELAESETQQRAFVAANLPQHRPVHSWRPAVTVALDAGESATVASFRHGEQGMAEYRRVEVEGREWWVVVYRKDASHRGGYIQVYEPSLPTFEGTVIAREGNPDWETCKTPGLAAAVGLVERDYRERDQAIFNAVRALSTPEQRAAEEANPFLVGDETPEQEALRAELQAQAAREGYSSKRVGESWVLCTPKGRVIYTPEKEVFNQAEAYSLSRQRVTVELAPEA